MGGRLLRRRRRGGAGPRRRAQRRSDRVVDRLPGRLEDGARLLRRLRPQAQRALRLPAALRDLPARPGRLAAARGGSPTSTSLVLLGFGVSHFFFNRAEIGVSVPLDYPALALPARAQRSGSGCGGRGEGLRPVWPTMWLVVAALFLMGVRVGLNVADAGVDRRRLRGRGRRRPDRPRRTDLRQLPRRHLPGRHLRPGQLPRLRPLRADLALVGQLGRPARRPRRLGRLRRRRPSSSCSCSASGSARDPRASAWPRSSPSAGPPTPTPPTSSSRTRTTPWSLPCSWPPSSSLRSPWPVERYSRCATWAKFAPAVLAPMSAYQPVRTCRYQSAQAPIRRPERPRVSAPLARPAASPSGCRRLLAVLACSGRRSTPA